MRERFDQRGVHCEKRVKEVRETNPMSLRHESKQATVAVKTPGPALLHHLDPGLVVAVQELISHLARGAVLYVSSSASEPNHCVLTTVTRASGKIPFTVAFVRRSSSLLILMSVSPWPVCRRLRASSCADRYLTARVHEFAPICFDWTKQNTPIDRALRFGVGWTIQNIELPDRLGHTSIFGRGPGRTQG